MITDVVKAVADMFSNFFGWRTSASDNQATHEVIDDKKDLERACSFAEEAIEIAEEHAVFLKQNYHFKFKFLVKKFRKCR